MTQIITVVLMYRTATANVDGESFDRIYSPPTLPPPPTTPFQSEQQPLSLNNNNNNQTVHIEMKTCAEHTSYAMFVYITRHILQWIIYNVYRWSFTFNNTTIVAKIDQVWGCFSISSDTTLPYMKPVRSLYALLSAYSYPMQHYNERTVFEPFKALSDKLCNKYRGAWPFILALLLPINGSTGCHHDRRDKCRCRTAVVYKGCLSHMFF